MTGNSRIHFVRLPMLIAIGVTVATGLGFLGSAYWVFDLFSHFRMQYLGLLLLAALIFSLAGYTRWVWLLLPAIVVNGALLAPYYLPNDRTVSSAALGGNAHAAATARAQGSARMIAHGSDGPTLRLLSLNVYRPEGDPAKVAALLHDTEPDIVVLSEVDRRWMTALAPALSPFPYRVVSLRGDNFGIALLSRYPLEDTAVWRFGPEQLPSVIGTARSPLGDIAVAGTHPMPPYSEEATLARDGQLAGLGVHLTGRRNVVLLGDLNATPWSYGFKQLITASRLRQCERIAATSGRPWRTWGTWPADTWWLRIPIDHCLAGKDVEVVAHRVGAAAGSDHLPLITDVRLHKPSKGANAPTDR